MNSEQRILALDQLGVFLSTMDEEAIEQLVYKVEGANPWFTEKNIKNALCGITKFLDQSVLHQFVSSYESKDAIKNVGIIMAGNIPAVGFHDLVMVLLAGGKAVVKLSSQDVLLMKFLIEKLQEIEPRFEIEIVDRLILADLDGVIATGSNNTSRYFEIYFASKPHIIRKSRTSCVVIKGDETEEEIVGLGNDLFAYFGLGCRNVTKLFIPENYDIITLFPHWENWSRMIHMHKYDNNYTYNKSVYLVNRVEHFDTGYALFMESPNLFSPLSVYTFTRYKDENDLKEMLTSHEDEIQCVVGAEYIPFGQSQYPEIHDFADHIDTFKFLLSL